MTKVIVLGLGGMGSAAAAHLAAPGRARARGSSSSRRRTTAAPATAASRVIRQAYFEDPAYVPLLLRAYELWARPRGDDSGRDLLTLTGGLMRRPARTPTVAGSLLASAREHGPAARAARRRARSGGGSRRSTPADDEVGLYEADSRVRPARARPSSAHLRRAGRAGADLRFEEPALGWAADGSRRPGDHRREARTTAGRLVICARRLGAAAAGRPRASR